jgi:large subunit ribosomal protein L20
MPRATNAPASRKRRKRILNRAKGFRGARSRLIRTAKDAVFKSRQWEYRDRKNRKRTFRGLWIQRINAAARERGLTYSRFMEGLKGAHIDLDRKVLADIAVTDPTAFDVLADQARAGLEAKGKCGAVSSEAVA